MAIKVKQIFGSDTLNEVIEKLNYNFDQVVINGGGLRGFIGNQGSEGRRGNTGRSGAEIQVGSYPPLNNASALNIIKDNILNVQIGDYYLYSGEDNIGAGYYKGDLFEVSEASGLITGVNDFELIFKINLRGPSGESASEGSTTPSYISAANSVKRNNQSEQEIVINNKSFNKPFLPADSALSTRNVDIGDTTAINSFIAGGSSDIILLKSYDTTTASAGELGINFFIEDPEFEDLTGLSPFQLIESRRAQIRYYKDPPDRYILDIANLYESEGVGGSSPIKGDIQIRSSINGDIFAEYGKNFQLDMRSDVIGDADSYDGEIRLRSRRRNILRNEVDGNSSDRGYVLLEQVDNKISSGNIATSFVKLENRKITLETLRSNSASQNIDTKPNSINVNSDYIHHKSVDTVYDFLVHKMEKQGSNMKQMIFNDGGGNKYYALKSSYNRGSKLFGADDAEDLSDYWMQHNFTTGNSAIKSGVDVTESVERSSYFEFNSDSFTIRRRSADSAIFGTSASRLPYLDIRDNNNDRGIVLGWGSATSDSTKKYTELRTETDYTLFFNTRNSSTAKFIFKRGGTDSDALKSTYAKNSHVGYTFMDGSLNITNSDVNLTDRSLNLTESYSNPRGFRFRYNGSGNDQFLLESNDNGTDWLSAFRVDRVTRNIGVNITAPIEKLHVGGRIRASQSIDVYGLRNPSGGPTMNMAYDTSISTGLLRSRDWNAGLWKDMRLTANRIILDAENGTDQLTGTDFGGIHISNSGGNFVKGISFGTASNAYAGVFAQSTGGGGFNPPSDLYSTQTSGGTTAPNGTQLVFSTTPSFAAGKTFKTIIDPRGKLILEGNSIYLNKSNNSTPGGGTESFLFFAAQTGGNDAGYIRHYESSNTSDLTFVVSDDEASNDTFTWKGSGHVDAMKLTTSGVLTLKSTFNANGTINANAISASSISTTGNSSFRGLRIGKSGSNIAGVTDPFTISFSDGGGGTERSVILYGSSSDTLNLMMFDGNLQRGDHNVGHLEGSYNNIGKNNTRSNPIYTKGSAYNPASSSLGNMFGIGFSNGADASFLNNQGFTSGWGLYVAADGDARIFLDGSDGTINGTRLNVDNITVDYVNALSGTSTFQTTAQDHVVKIIKPLNVGGSHAALMIATDGEVDDIGLEIRGKVDAGTVQTSNSGTSPDAKIRLYGGGDAAIGSRLFFGTTNSGANSYLNPISDGALRHQTPNGYIEIGPKNTSWGHIHTDRSRFHFNRGAYFEGELTAERIPYLKGNNYISSGQEKPNNSIFGAGKLRYQMLQDNNIGSDAPTWNDVLWISSHTGGGVKGSNALVMGKTADFIGFQRQDYDAVEWGPLRTIYHSGNLNTSGINSSGESTKHSTNSVTSDDIAAGEVNTSELATGAVTTSKIAMGSVDYQRIDDTVMARRLAPSNANNAITSAIYMHTGGKYSNLPKNLASPSNCIGLMTVTRSGDDIIQQIIGYTPIGTTKGTWLRYSSDEGSNWNSWEFIS